MPGWSGLPGLLCIALVFAQDEASLLQVMAASPQRLQDVPEIDDNAPVLRCSTTEEAARAIAQGWQSDRSNEWKDCYPKDFADQLATLDTYAQQFESFCQYVKDMAIEMRSQHDWQTQHDPLAIKLSLGDFAAACVRARDDPDTGRPFTLTMPEMVEVMVARWKN